MAVSALLPLLALAIATSTTPAAPAEQEILRAIDATFAALESGDAASLLRLVNPEGRVTARGVRADGTPVIRSLIFADYAAKMKPGGGFVERITQPLVRQDADVAMVWAPFTVALGGKIVSCGYDHFDLVRDSGSWKILNITYSTRMTECPGP
jgi:hypothetical protein